MKKTVKSVLAVVLSLCLLLSVAPLGVFADTARTICFETGDFSGNTAIYNVDGNNVEITVSGANIDNGTVYVPNNDMSGISFTVGGDFDADSMRVVFRGANNYNGEATVGQNGAVDFSGLVLPEGELRLAVESNNSGNAGNDEEHTIHFKDAVYQGNNTFVYGTGNDAITLTVVNADVDQNGDIFTHTTDELYAIEFELGGAFDDSTMHVYALALDGYVGEMFIVDGDTATFVNPDPNGENLHFPNEVFISFDSYLMYAVAVDSNGRRYFDNETMYLEPGESMFVCVWTHPDNASHGVFPAVGFNYGVAGEGNFPDSLTSMGFTVQEGAAEDFGYTDDWLQGCYGCQITVPNDMKIGTTARMPYSLYELPENFSWDNMWANFSWSETPTVLTNNLYFEVVPTWDLHLDLFSYTPQAHCENMLSENETFYIARGEELFIRVDSDYNRNTEHGVLPYFVFLNEDEVRQAGFNVVYGDAHGFGYPDECGTGILLEAGNNMREGQAVSLEFAIYEYPDGADPYNYEVDLDNETPVATCSATAEIRNYNPCIYMVDQYGMIYNDGDSIFFDEDETKAIAFRTDSRNADHGYYKDYIGWDTDVLENAGFTIVNAGPAFLFDDYRDDFWNDDYIIIVSAENLNFGVNIDYDTWLFENPGENEEFDWDTTPKTQYTTFNFKVAPLYGTTGDCDWSYDIGSKTIEISGDGAMADYGMLPGLNEPVPSPWSGYRIEKVVVEDGVTHIGQDAFIFSDVYDVEIADSVTSIGTNAFNGCGALDFVMLPENLTSVGDYAFAGTSLREIEIYAGVTSIGQCAFGYYYDEQAGEDVTVNGFEVYGYANTAAETYANANGFTFHDNTVYLSQDGLWKYSIRPDGGAVLTSDIPWGYSYQGNASVVEIPSVIDGHTVKELGACAMSGLTFITKITVPDTVDNIGFSAFSGCTNLYELELGNNIEVIGAQTIDNTNLGSNPAYHIDGGIYINNYLFRVDQNYQGGFHVREGTRLMAFFAFGNCSQIDRVELPDSITSIGMAMFVGCGELREIFIPASVTSIECRFEYYDDTLGREICPLERIYGYFGSYAEQYANDNGYDFVGIATSGTTGDCEWEYDLDSHSLTISGNGAMSDYGQNNPAPWAQLDVETLTVGNGVTRIGNDAFMGLRIYDAQIADSVTSIGNNAFHSCGALDFVILPANLTSVGAYAFYNTSMREVEIYAGVTSIGQCAFGFFYDWDNDRDAAIDGFIVYGYGETEAKTYADFNGFTFVDNTVYLSQDGLWKYSIRPDGGAVLTSDIPWGYSYQGNASVVEIPSIIDGHTVKELGACAMSGLTFITKITVPDTVDSIGFSAFSGCTNLSELVLGNGITVIGAQTVDETALAGNRANYVNGGLYVNGYLLRADMNYEGTMTVRPGTKLMAMFSFGNCNKIERVVLPDSITRIDQATFVGCTALKEILIPHSVQFIYDRAFLDHNEQTGQTERSLRRIYGSPNTTAEAFADANGIEFVNIEEITSGDTNEDGEITIADYQITKEYICGSGLIIYGLIAGDVNKDGAVDAFDLFEIDKLMNNIGLTDYTYTVTSGNNAKINGYVGTDSTVKVPARIDGYNVTGIDSYTFKNNTRITKVTLSEGIKTVGYGAFLNCTSLTEVTLPETATSIGTYAFKGCTNLEKIVIPAGVTSINANSFTGCSNVTIYGVTGSFAQTYANNNSIPFVAIA